MPYFLSTPDLITGNRFLDAEHMNLIQLIDALIAACESGASVGTMGLHAEHLLDFAQDHFERENREMRRTDFDDQERHAQDHARLLGDLGALKQQLDAGQPLNCAQTYHYLRVWLRNHIVQFDIPMVASKRFEFGNPAAPH